MKKISIVSPCYNEEKNLAQVYAEVKNVFVNHLKNYEYEHIFIDNASTDSSELILRKIASEDKNVKVILNSRNFGSIKSPIHGLFQATGDAIILLASDLQDPPNLIIDFVKSWERGNEIIIGIKTNTHESKILFAIGTLYYNLISKISETKPAKNYNGFGLYDKKIIELIKKLEDPYPYFRGLVFKVGFKIDQIKFVQPKRNHGISSSNFYSLFDVAMLGICTNSKIPFRIFTFIGFIMLAFSIATTIIKLLLGNVFEINLSPTILSLFFLSSLLLLLGGILGEYISIILTKITKEPLAIERERINF